MKTTGWTRLALIVTVLAGTSVAAGAAPITVSCPGTAATTDREFTLTTDPGATCLAWGAGNINGNNDAVNVLGYVTLDKSDDTVSGVLPGVLTATPPESGLFGTFSIAPTAATQYSNFVIAFKSGQGQFDPDWAAFVLPAGVLSGSWAISQQQELSHVNLYGIRCTTTPCTPPTGDPIPEPATMLLVGLGLAAAGVARRHRR